MKTKTLIGSGFLLLAIGCSSSTPYDQALAACVAKCPSKATKCNNIRNELTTLFQGKSQNCIDTTATFTLNCETQNCDSTQAAQTCADGYKSQIEAACQ